MPPKRKRTAALPAKGLLPGEQLNRAALSGPSSWSWVGTEVHDAKHITSRHRLLACHLDVQSPCHVNKYTLQQESQYNPSPEYMKPISVKANGELEDDIIIISDDEPPICSKKECKSNPMCLNYLGQDIWEDEEESEKRYLDVVKVGIDPSQTSREVDIPVGLKNLGATCYANASLQVWFRDLAFRSGVYSCQPPDGTSEEKYMDSPIFQLQATFAALQEGNQSPFNPRKLVESLQLRTAEQQDAQEFSKLFMSHLDAEFRKQSSVSTQKLIANQFQGSQVYGTICHSCKNRSERSSDFLELEINFDQNSTLEDRISASLVPETLTGENKYFCSRCESLQDATRYSELRQLPPVLHFSLLRFVYDFDTMERKKLKHSISFPQTLDMNKYVGSKNGRNSNATEVEDNLYELRGILLHKGASAYHGHYEARVYDTELESWFQFNDESVTKIDTLGDKSTLKSSKPKKDPPKESLRRVNNTNARKRRRIEDSDDDIVEIDKLPAELQVQEANDMRLISSKDAYMLIYAKTPTKTSRPSDIPKVPAKVMNVVKDLNSAHDIALGEYKAKLAKTKAQFLALRNRLKEVYCTWSTNLTDDSIIVSRQALESWLSDECIQADRLRHQIVEGPGPDALTILTSDIVCKHGHLDPTKWKDMKIISRDAFCRIETATGCTFNPLLDQSNVCVECISSMFEEKLYAIKHPELVQEFEDMSFCAEDEEGCWISKKWLRDWKTNKPRMHITGQSDPAPDSDEFRDHIFCEHGGLSLNITNRRKISRDATALLKGLFPTWAPLDSETETCAVCDAQVHISKEDKRENRRLVENEKALLKFIYEPSLDSWASGVEHNAFAVIPSHFVKSWRRWLAQPNATTKPVTFDNDVFFCEHHMLIFDPNDPIDMDSGIVLIHKEEWNILQTVYNGGPLICLVRRSHEEGGGYSHDVSVCAECRMKKKSDWTTTDVTLRLLKSNELQKNKENQDAVATYTRRADGSRQSKRLRQAKSLEERRKITVGKSTTVKDIKIMANQAFSIPTICQRLFYNGSELDDNSATVKSLQILANDIIDLQEAEESEDALDSDAEAGRPKRRREEGYGFGGTILGNVDSSLSSSPAPMPPMSSSPDIEKACLSCTFSNAPDALMCEMCETMFA